MTPQMWGTRMPQFDPPQSYAVESVTTLLIRIADLSERIAQLEREKAALKDTVVELQQALKEMR